MWVFIPEFQLPNLPLFTLKIILLLPCIGSLYITSMVNCFVQVHPWAFLPLKERNASY